jgi:hypothetical protein
MAQHLRCGAAFALRPFVHGAAFLSAKTSVCGTFRTYATADNAGAEIPQSWLLPRTTGLFCIVPARTLRSIRQFGLLAAVSRIAAILPNDLALTNMNGP